jgi:hypothetical protein
MSPSPSNRNI